MKNFLRKFGMLLLVKIISTIIEIMDEVVGKRPNRRNASAR